MTMQEQIELERSATVEPRERAVAGLKTILLHVQNDDAFKQRLETALSLARACEAHLTCLHVTPIEAYVAFDGFGGVFVMSDIMKTLDDEEQALRATVEKKLSSEDVSWDYQQTTGNIAGQLISHAALADIVVTGREPYRADFAGPAITMLGDLLYRTRTPLFIPGDKDQPSDPTGVALIAWNGSFEAANAVRSSVGLLKLASDVHILQVEEEKDDRFPGTRLLEYLSRHGIHAELERATQKDKRSIAACLIAHAKAVNATYIVMGGYSHTRVGEFVFGGVTRTLLEGCPIPLLIAH